MILTKEGTRNGGTLVLCRQRRYYALFRLRHATLSSLSIIITCVSSPCNMAVLLGFTYMYNYGFSIHNSNAGVTKLSVQNM